MTSSIITYNELEPKMASYDTLAAFCKDAISRHKQSEMYKWSVLADEYARQRNTTIMRYTNLLYLADGSQAENFTASQTRIASNFFKRLNTQRCNYLLGKPISFLDAGDTGTDKTKAMLGGRKFDNAMHDVGIKALMHGISFPYWDIDHLDAVFTPLEFVPIWDSYSGTLRAGIYFWQLGDEPQNVVLYAENGVTEFVAKSKEDTNLQVLKETHAYKTHYEMVPAEGLALAVGDENYSKLPIIPVWGTDAHQSTLVGMREAIDAYDLIKSGFANDVQDCAEIYWIVENAGGMTPADLEQFRDRLKLFHVAGVDTGMEQSVKPYTQEVPHETRKAILEQIQNDIYRDFGALDVHTVAAGATNDHIDAAYQPLDEEADEFERHISQAIIDLLALVGIDDTPVFTRNRISNQKEQVEIVISEAQYLDQETILRKLPNIDPQEVAEILKKLDEEAEEKMANLPPALQDNALGKAVDDTEEDDSEAE